MPEGPSIVILKEQVQPFKGCEILQVSGNSKIDQGRLLNQKITDFKSWGKHFLVCFDGFTLKVHFMLFGSYRINETKDTVPRLSLQFENGFLNFYTCSVKFIEGDLNKVYDWTGDIMSDAWNPDSALDKLKLNPDLLACDALLEQGIFAGSGNIIKNEVLFRQRIHPLTIIGKLPETVLKNLIDETRNYAFDFLAWKKNFELRKNLLAHNRKICPRCDIPFTKAKLGKHDRRSFFCEKCQVRYL